MSKDNVEYILIAQIEEHEKYFVDSNGCIYRKLNTKVDKHGYEVFSFYGKNKKMVYRFVHRIVAKAFLFNDNLKTEVNHKDANKLNNRLSNLEWVTRHENIEHAKSLGRYKNSGRIKESLKPRPF